ncbi:hypothetical protein VZT92_004433 [Zoarces viviparus]|uniref:CARD domain-containing protein n=1 Tax=Zoarces viviparus TaxID=48416 RepID=A0AAW1FXX3_ZOAVI
MSAKDTVRRNKTAIVQTLCGDYNLILTKVDEKNLITPRENRNLKSINKEDVEGHVIGLVDKLTNKGEDSCKAFLNLLQTDADIINTFPELKSMQWNDTSILTKLQPVHHRAAPSSTGPVLSSQLYGLRCCQRDRNIRDRHKGKVGIC